MGDGTGSSGANAGNNPGSGGMSTPGPGAGNTSGAGAGGASGAAGAAAAAKGAADAGAAAKAGATASAAKAAKASEAKSTTAKTGNMGSGASTSAGAAAAAAKAAAGKAAATASSNKSGNASPGAGAGAAAAAAKAAATGGLAKAAAAQGANLGVGASKTGPNAAAAAAANAARSAAANKAGALGVGTNKSGPNAAAAASANQAAKSGLLGAQGDTPANAKVRSNNLGVGPTSQGFGGWGSTGGPQSLAEAAKNIGLAMPGKPSQTMGGMADNLARTMAVTRGPGIGGLLSSGVQNADKTARGPATRAVMGDPENAANIATEAQRQGLKSNLALSTTAQTHTKQANIIGEAMRSIAPQLQLSRDPEKMMRTIAGEAAVAGVPGMAAVAAQMMTRGIPGMPSRYGKTQQYAAARDRGLDYRAATPGTQAFHDAMRAATLGMAPSSMVPSGVRTATHQRMRNEASPWSAESIKSGEVDFGMQHWGNPDFADPKLSREGVAKTLGDRMNAAAPGATFGAAAPSSTPESRVAQQASSAAVEAASGQQKSRAAQAQRAASLASQRGMQHQAAERMGIMGAPSFGYSDQRTPGDPSTAARNAPGFSSGLNTPMNAATAAAQVAKAGPVAVGKSDMGMFGQPGQPMGPQAGLNPGTPGALNPGQASALGGMISGAMDPGLMSMQNIAHRADERRSAQPAPTSTPRSDMAAPDLASALMSVQNLAHRADERNAAMAAPAPTPRSDFGVSQPMTGAPPARAPIGNIAMQAGTNVPGLFGVSPPTPGVHPPNPTVGAPPPGLHVSHPPNPTVGMPAPTPAAHSFANQAMTAENQGILTGAGPFAMPGETKINVEQSIREMVEKLGPEFSQFKAWMAPSFDDRVASVTKSKTGGWSFTMKDGTVINTDPKGTFTISRKDGHVVSGAIAKGARIGASIPGQIAGGAIPSSENLQAATANLFTKPEAPSTTQPSRPTPNFGPRFGTPFGPAPSAPAPSPAPAAPGPAPSPAPAPAGPAPAPAPAPSVTSPAMPPSRMDTPSRFGPPTRPNQNGFPSTSMNPAIGGGPMVSGVNNNGMRDPVFQSFMQGIGMVPPNASGPELTAEEFLALLLEQQQQQPAETPPTTPTAV